MKLPKSTIEPFGHIGIPQVHSLMDSPLAHRYAKVVNAFFRELRAADITKETEEQYEVVALRVKADLADFLERECKK